MGPNDPLRIAIRRYMEKTGETDLYIHPDRGTFSESHTGLLHYLFASVASRDPLFKDVSFEPKDIIKALNDECPPPKGCEGV